MNLNPVAEWLGCRQKRLWQKDHIPEVQVLVWNFCHRGRVVVSAFLCESVIITNCFQKFFVLFACFFVFVRFFGL